MVGFGRHWGAWSGADANSAGLGKPGIFSSLNLLSRWSQGSNDSPRIGAYPDAAGASSTDGSDLEGFPLVFGFGRQQAENLERYCQENNIRLPALNSSVQVLEAPGDGFCFVHAALQSQGKTDSDTAVQDSISRAQERVPDFLQKNLDPSHCSDIDSDLQATLALKMDWITDELQGYLNHTGQTLLAYSEQACYVVLSTSTATDELIGIGKTTFGKLVAVMSHLSVTVVGEPEFGTMCILIRHKHPDPEEEGQYGLEHFMPGVPARGVLHSFNTPAQVWGRHLLEIRELQMREGTMNHEEDQPELNQAESQAVSVKASPIYKMQTAEESPVPPVSQIVPPVTAIHHHLAATAMQPADESVKGDSRLQLLCDEHSTGQPQLKADMPSLVQTDRRTDDASDEAEPAEQHQGTPEQPQGTPEQPQGIPGAHKRGSRRGVKEACKAAGISFAKGLKNTAAWLKSCPGRAVNLIQNFAAAVLGCSRPSHQ